MVLIVVIVLFVLFGFAELSDSVIYFPDLSPHMSVHERVDERVNDGVAISQPHGKDTERDYVRLGNGNILGVIQEVWSPTKYSVEDEQSPC